MEEIQALSANLQTALGYDGTSANLGCSGICFNPYPAQYPVYYSYCSHNIGPDEELLLNALRRDPAIKAALLKTALSELIKTLK